MSMSGLPVLPPRKRVITYIDGFNLYFGLKDGGLRRFLWLDLVALAQTLIRNDQDLIETKYFTSRIVKPPEKKKRQSTYLEALGAHCGPRLKMYFGHFRSDPWQCDNCGVVKQVRSEKKTDVNIAVEIMTDAFTDLFDTALVISADSDLVPVVLAVKRLFPEKRILIAFPPKRHSVELQHEAHASFTIGTAKFAQSQMPDVITKPEGTKLTRPAKWVETRTEFGRILGATLKRKD